MSMATKPATAASGTRAFSRSGAKAAAADTGLLRERAASLRAEGLSDADLRRELRDEGFTSADISSTLGPKSTGGDAPRPPDAPAPPSRPAQPAPSTSRSVGIGPLRIRTPGTPAGMMLAVVAYPAVLAYLTGGPVQLKAWFRAKFLNQTSTDPGIRAEVFVQPTLLSGGTSGGSTVRPTAALSTYGRPPAAAAPVPAPTAAPKNSDGLPSKASGPNAYNAITGTWGDSTAAASARGARAVAFARSQLGKPYRWGGTGPDRWDCSGLTQAAWRAAGVKIPRTTAQQILTGRRVARKNLVPGDLVFSARGHVQLYAGGGQVIEAPRTGLKVRVATLGPFLTARRPG